ncbi:squalene-associated FAD-dependent desaturase [Roseiarcus fermentans]|uniref:Squalene-associated FAD-dependent desaturase n=1 Tax=Roseiarcus fermentans TaxID=1473586 RepID=A0A366FBZ5_9HYPH|nr:hydroxysqualene dehydroxylase HpnE [Roseiarcus fermentans]RBP12193.1 squalene-associated FAD-dependent desaturase [Roseiarcus fermentans]
MSVVHVVGAGVAGLSAAVRLADEGVRVVLHEAAATAGGRCRSYQDPALGLAIDNGNHLLLSGNHAALDYLDRIGSRARLQGPASAMFDFADLKTGERWRLHPSDGRAPWWLLDSRRRVPGAPLSAYLAPLATLTAAKTASLGEVMTCSGPLYDRLWGPVLLAALNTDPAEGSARLAAAMLRETLFAGGRACRPLVAVGGLSACFVEPALLHLASRGATVRFGARLRGVAFAAGRAAGLDFADGRTALAGDDAVILAVPPPVARELLPDLDAPDEFRAIVNAHFRVAPAGDQPLILGVVNGLTQWIFSYPEHVSTTISGADRLIDEPREALARAIWAEVAALGGYGPDLPPWQIVKEKRATFAATPAQDARRPPARTAFANVALAGDWTQTGLPATIEGAVRSGYAAAAVVTGRRGKAGGSR